MKWKEIEVVEVCYSNVTKSQIEPQPRTDSTTIMPRCDEMSDVQVLKENDATIIINRYIPLNVL